MAKVDKYSIHGLKRRPTYSEIIGMLDDNEKITGKLPDRSATIFRNSPEGSYFDGSDAMEQLREEQGRLLLYKTNERPIVKAECKNSRKNIPRRTHNKITRNIPNNSATNSTNGCRARNNQSNTGNPNGTNIQHPTGIANSSRTKSKNEQCGKKKNGNIGKSPWGNV